MVIILIKSGKKISSLILKVCLICIGLCINGFGLALLYSVELGTSPMATFSDGLHNILGISQGNANIVANAVFLVVLLFIGRRYISVGTILCTFTIGLYVDLAQWIIGPLNLISLPLPGKVAVAFLGMAIMGAGLGMYVAVDFGLGPLEALVGVINDRTNLSYRTSKTVFDAALGVLGVVFGGKIGIGTVISIGCTGFVMDFSRTLTKHALTRISLPKNADAR